MHPRRRLPVLCLLVLGLALVGPGCGTLMDGEGLRDSLGQQEGPSPGASPDAGSSPGSGTAGEGRDGGSEPGTGAAPDAGTGTTPDAGTDPGTPDSGTLTCDATQGLHLCSSACVPENEGSCGPTCQRCNAPSNATASCNAGQCDFTCQAPYLKSGGECVLVASVSTGVAHTCAVLVNGSLKCWGANEAGQLGDGTQDDRVRPVDVIGLDAPVTAVAAGGTHTCALMGDAARSVRCWGQLGTGATPPSLVPVAVLNLAEVEEVAAGEAHTCARTANAAVDCWGSNAEGQLGGTSPADERVRVVASGASRVTAGLRHSCAVVGGSVRCWGANGSGQLGNGTTQAPPRGTLVTPTGMGSRVDSVVAGAQHTCAVQGTAAAADAVGYCWGDNASGQLGRGAGAGGTGPTPAPVVRLAPDELEMLLTGGAHTCSREREAESGALTWHCWGANDGGQGGRTTEPDPSRPADLNVGGISSLDIRGLHLGGRHTCALVREGPLEGVLRCWGANERGQLGDGTSQETPNVDARYVSGQ